MEYNSEAGRIDNFPEPIADGELGQNTRTDYNPERIVDGERNRTSRRIVVRYNPFFLLLTLIPAVIGFATAYSSYIRSTRPLVQDIGLQVKVCGAFECQYFQKDLINSSSAQAKGFLWQYEGGQNILYKNYTNSAQASLEAEKQNAVFFVFFAGLVTLATFILFFLNRIVLEYEVLRIYRFGILTHKIPINKIRKINIETPPFLPARTSVDETSWQDTVHLTYEATDSEHTIFIKEFLFSDFKKIVKIISESTQPLEILFSKETVLQNIKRAL